MLKGRVLLLIAIGSQVMDRRAAHQSVFVVTETTTRVDFLATATAKLDSKFLELLRNNSTSFLAPHQRSKLSTR
jgi:hypothetical protein